MFGLFAQVRELVGKGGFDEGRSQFRDRPAQAPDFFRLIGVAAIEQRGLPILHRSEERRVGKECRL